MVSVLIFLLPDPTLAFRNAYVRQWATATAKHASCKDSKGGKY